MCSNTKIYLLAALSFLLISNFSFGQKLEPKSRPLEPDHFINSKITGEKYQLYISFPSSYSTEDSLTYPVLYVLDGAYSFPTFNLINRRLSSMRMIQDVVIVGIHSGTDRNSWFINRTLDYTPTSDTLDDRKAEKKFGIPEGKLSSGGAQKFLECIKNEITPLIEKHYKVNQERGIAGHSLGGLFAAYCFVNSDGYFNRFGLNSPSLWWEDEKFLKEAVDKFKVNKAWEIPPSKVFVSVGEKETEIEIPTVESFCQHLRDANYKNIELTWQIFTHETHMTVMPASMSRTITVLYANE